MAGVRVTVPPEWNDALRRIEENDPALKGLWVYFSDDENESMDAIGVSDEGHVQFYATVGRSSAEFFARLGDAVGNNTQLGVLGISGTFGGAVAPGIANNTAFLDGLKRNSSVRKMFLQGLDLSDEAVCGLLNSLGQDSSNLTNGITFMVLHQPSLRGVENDDGLNALKAILRKCTNLTDLAYPRAEYYHVQFHDVLEAIEHPGRLASIITPLMRRAGFEALAPLLRDTNSNLRKLNIRIEDNDIDPYMAVALLAKSETVEELNLNATHPVDVIGYLASLGESFSKALCDTSTIDGTYFSNHTLQRLTLLGSPRGVPAEVNSILQMNCLYDDKNCIAIQKVLRYHPSFDMAPFFEWDLKALPLVIDWLDRAKSLWNLTPDVTIDSRKISAIYQFIHAIPEVFESMASSDSGGKRKRGGDSSES